MNLNLEKEPQLIRKDNEELLENYRPVSTLPIFGKIFEKVIYMTDYTTDSLVFAKIILKVMPLMFLSTVLKQQSVMETMSLRFLLI